MENVDLTGPKVLVLGNRGDQHLFRLSNPGEQAIIESEGQYEAEFISHLGEHTQVDLNISEVSAGNLIIPITISNGIYRIRRLAPRKTILSIEIQAQ